MSSRFAAIVEPTNFHDLAFVHGEHLPSVGFTAQFTGGGSAHDLQADEDLVTVGNDLRHPSSDTGFTALAIPSQHLRSVLAAWFRVVWRAPTNVRVQQLADRPEVR